MRIKIEHKEIESYFNFRVLEVANYSEIITNYIQDHYFNGADSAVVFIADDKEYIILDLIPN